MSVNTKVNGELVKSAGLYSVTKPVSMATIYSEDEQEIGLWTDGKPLYQKSIKLDDITVPQSSRIITSLDGYISDLDTIVGAEAITTDVNATVPAFQVATLSQYGLSFYVNKVDGIVISRGSDSGTVTRDFVITIRYTKTTDTPWSGFVPQGYGYESLGDCYSTEEREVGCWIDGKPVYQITYYISALPSTAGSTVYSTGITGVENVWLKDCIIGNSNGFNVRNDQDAYSSFRTASITFRPSVNDEESKINCYNGQDRHTQTAYVTVMYTKINDAAGSGTYLPNGDKSIHYSTDEQVIGTWVDGSTLYRKVINFGQLPANSQKTVDHNISNLNLVTKLYGVAVRPASEGVTYSAIPLPMAHYQTIGNQEELAISGTYVSIRNGNSNAGLYTSCYVTVEYTKTS